MTGNRAIACLVGVVVVVCFGLIGTLDRASTTPTRDPNTVITPAPTPLCEAPWLPTVQEPITLCRPWEPIIELAPDGCDGGSLFAQELVQDVANYTRHPTTITCRDHSAIVAQPQPTGPVSTMPVISDPAPTQAPTPAPTDDPSVPVDANGDPINP